jgi:hypothetical protein
MALHPVHRLAHAKAYGERLERDGASARPAGVRSRGGRSPADVAIVIRLSRPEDEPALVTLAALDSRPLPAAQILVAEADGAIRAALSLSDRAVIADPFHRTAPLVALLNARAEQLRAEPGPRRWFRRRPPRPGAAQTARSAWPAR